MTFLDLAEGDKLAVVVVELHVGPSASHAESGQTEYIMLLVICLDFLHFHFLPFPFLHLLRTHTHTHTFSVSLFPQALG